MTNSKAIGVIAIDGGGKVEFQTGIGAEPQIRDAILELHRSAGDDQQRLCALPGSKLIVLAFQSGGCSIYLVHDSAKEKTLLDFIASVDFAYSILNQLVSSMAVVDERARLRFISPMSASTLGLAAGQGLGKDVVDVIPNTRLHEVVKSGRPEFGTLDVLGHSRIVSRRPIHHNGRIVGAIGQLMFKAPEQLHALSREVARLKMEVDFYQRELSVARTQVFGLERIIGSSKAVSDLKADIARIAPLDVPVLLLGESGTGKELVAHAMHSLSGRAPRPLVAVNAAALPANLVESELFGYEPGAFTGAERKGRKGKFEIADKSTLFLDEIGDMPPEVQVKLLRVIQDGMFERIGSDKPRYSGFRLICASNRDLQQLIDGGKFRLDLYYRISAVTLRLPALKERLEDIPLLVTNFIEAYARRHPTARVRSVHSHVYAYLCERSWPGNVRQLLHEVEKAAIFCDHEQLSIADFRDSGAPRAHVEQDVQTEKTAGTLSAAYENVELRLIKEALVRHKGNKSRVADELGISRSHLYKRLSVLSSDGA